MQIIEKKNEMVDYGGLSEMEVKVAKWNKSKE